ncbi:MAG: acyltransferase family protein [Gemmataceae bacterium]
MPSNPNALSNPPSSRLLSIDALRGFDMFWIVGGEELFKALAHWANWSHKDLVDEQLEHVPWEGFHFYDLIFPLFLFVVGVVLPFSLGALRLRGESPRQLHWRIVRRTVLLFALGLLYNHFLQFDFEKLRVAGVLQRIALCYGIAALIVMHTSVRGQAVITAALLLGYWALLASVAAPGHSAGDYTIEGNLPGYVDRHYLPGKIYQEYYGYGDNEGLLSTIPAVATALLGALAGQWLLTRRAPVIKVLGLAAAGGVCLLLGNLWSHNFPVIKNLWTSSFVLVAGGWSLLLLALFYGVIDVMRLRFWAYFFIVIGANAITIYFLAHTKIVDFEAVGKFFFGGVINRSGSFQPVMTALSVIVVEWLFLLVLYKNKIFLRV